MVIRFSFFAAPIVKTVSISYNDIKITLNGKQITPKDANGNAVDPFILNGSTYLPVRAVGEALGLEVDWDGKTNTVILNDKKAVTPAPPPATATKETKKFEGRLDKEDSVETYDFTLPYASRIILDFEHKFIDSNTEYWNIQFISKKYDEKILEFKSYGSAVKTSTNDKASYLPAGEYYVKVAEGGWHTTMDYTLTVKTQ
ncbi:MAG: copper amine oxidase N-terminal domain-containing protein [Oscillospiraceae bacterium]|nr:copper amine oxidase N-terminal domain-containing protein [Oscillospiraceae bacterium]